MLNPHLRSVRLVVLDRDGVINEDRAAFVRRPSDWVPITGSLEGIGRLTRAGLYTAMATNQSGLARGLIEPHQLEAIHGKLAAALEAHGGRLDALFVCPHGPSEGCACRKPRPGLLLRASQAFDVGPDEMVFIGDQETDLRAAQNAGMRAILVRTGQGEHAESYARARGIQVTNDLAAAIDMLLADRAR